MLNRTNSYVNKLEILQYFVEFPSEKKIRGKTRFILNSNQFGKVKQISSIEIVKGEQIEKVLDIEGPKRGKFREYVKELSKEKLITEIKTNDNRTKDYSITPLGICYLIKSEYFGDPLKITLANQKKIFPILESFATRYVKQYNSDVFENEKFDFTDIFYHFAMNGLDSHDIGEEMPIVFSNYTESQFGGIEFFISIDYNPEIKIPVARFKINDEIITISEWGKRIGLISGYFPFELNEEQFHHYLANLLICLTVYHHAKSDYRSTTDIINSWRRQEKRSRRKKKIDIEKEFKEFYNYSDDFLKILFLFNRQILKILNTQFELADGVAQILNQAQFKK